MKLTRPRLALVPALAIAATSAVFVPAASPAGAATQTILVPCDSSHTVDCYSIQVNGGTAPANLHVVVIQNSDVPGDHETEIHLYDKTGVTGNNDFSGWDQIPRSQGGDNGAKINLSGVLAPTDVITLSITITSQLVPQWTMFHGRDVLVSFTKGDGSVTATITGSAAMLATPLDSEHRLWDDPSTDYTGKCGHIRTREVACDVNQSSADALAFFGRMKVFGDPTHWGVAGLWISTNATFYQFPRLGADRRSIIVPTGAPHLLTTGEVHKGLTRAYLPKALFERFGLTYTEDAVRQILRVSQEKDGVVTPLDVTLTFDAGGVLVQLPELTFSAPVLTFGTNGTVAAPAPSLPATGNGGLIGMIAAMALLFGVAIRGLRRVPIR